MVEKARDWVEARVKALSVNQQKEADMQEAATIKAQAKGLLRTLTNFLDQKSVPADLRKEIEDVRQALNRTWDDLSAQADEEGMMQTANENLLASTTMEVNGERVSLEALARFYEQFSIVAEPYPGEHAARLNDPGKYKRFRRVNNKFGKGVDAIFGLVEGDGMEVQAIRFKVSEFTEAEAKEWLKEHEYEGYTFEPASEEAEEMDYDKLAGRVADKLFERIEAVKEALTKDGLPMSAYLVVKDEELVSTWRLPVYDADGRPDHGRMGAAWAALHGGYRGSSYDGPDKQEAIDKLTALYDSEGMETPPVKENEMAELAESVSGVEILSEGAAEPNAVGPLTMSVQLIRPGFGNAKDNHYYSKEMLKRDAPSFVGAKMHETDHRESDKTTRTWVSTVIGIKGFSDEGAPIGEVLVHDPSFAQRVRNLKAGNLLTELPCSILADGEVSEGEIDGKKANIVERITSVKNVDWVTKAGAGGKALDIEESDKEPVEEKTMLETEAVKAVLSETNLPEAAQARLAEAEYETKEALEARIDSERKYLAEVSDIGKPKDMNTKPVVKSQKPLAEREADVLKKYGIGR